MAAADECYDPRGLDETDPKSARRPTNVPAHPRRRRSSRTTSFHRSCAVAFRRLADDQYTSFQVHFPAPYEPWARHVGGKIESIRGPIVSAEVGFEPSGITDIIIADPFAQANGSAWPWIGSPRMIFWAAPPPPASALGNQADWGEMLAVHEEAHVVHLTRPSRKPFDRWMSVLSPVRISPLVNAPRWVSEGYATYLEGELTGMGRPNGDFARSS